MTSLNPNLMQMALSYDDLLKLAAVHAGELSPAEAPETLREAGIVTSDGAHPVAGSLVEVAVAPARSVVVERFDGAMVAPMFVGWLPDGRATMTTIDAGGGALVTATDLSLLRHLLRQWLVLLDRPTPAERAVVRTDTGVIDAAWPTGGGDPTGDPDLDAVLGSWQLAWRATGNWADRPTDKSLTVVDAGRNGWWQVRNEDLSVSQPREEPVMVALVPMTLDDVMSALGDVVTGRFARTSAENMTTTAV